MPGALLQVIGTRLLLRSITARTRALTCALPQVIGTRIGEGGLQLWREEGRDAGAFIKELSEVPQSHEKHVLCMQASSPRPWSLGHNLNTSNTKPYAPPPIPSPNFSPLQPPRFKSP